MLATRSGVGTDYIVYQAEHGGQALDFGFSPRACPECGGFKRGIRGRYGAWVAGQRGVTADGTE